MNLPNHIISLIQARLDSTAAMREMIGKPKWKTRGFRYDLEDFISTIHPEKVDARLIPMSQAAAISMPNGGTWREHQVADHSYEHAVPLAVLFESLMDVRESKEAISQTLSHLFHIIWVTDEEDRSLNAAGLNRKMPIGWTVTDSPFARYDTVGIEL